MTETDRVTGTALSELPLHDRKEVLRLRTLARDSAEAAELLLQNGKCRAALPLAREALDAEIEAVALALGIEGEQADVGRIREVLTRFEDRLRPGDVQLDQDELREVDDTFGRLDLLIDKADVLLKRALLTPGQREARDRWRAALRRVAAGTGVVLVLALGYRTWFRLTHGLRAEYFEGVSFDRLVATRVDRTIDFEDFSPYVPRGLGPEGFSVRWRGRLLAPQGGDYVLTVRSDDGVRLWIDDRLVLETWQQRAAEDTSAAVPLTAGAHALRIEYFQAAGQSACRLSWKTPSGAEETVPLGALLPD